ncbi:MAG: hypothetical protein ACREEK_09995, partial [Bradyrhizobium sp.]
SYRYRLQISISVAEKIYTGSSIIEVTWSCGPKIAGLGQCSSSLGGQATVIDLGSRGVVIAALRTGDNIIPVPEGAVDATWLCANAFGNRSTIEELPKLPLLKGRRELSPNNLPRLVWLSNPTDPMSVRKVTVGSVASTIDPTARFLEAFVEITREPIVADIPKKLSWYPAMLEKQKAGKLELSTPGQFRLFYNMFVGEDST